ncbi:MAG TPA: hypothetical protein VIM73_17820 [Polyangiaceae bacterium]
MDPGVDDEALLCALVLAPSTFSRNRFFGLFENPARKRLRRRASRVRGIIRQLVSPERGRAEILGERVLDDGQVLLRYQVEELGYSRTAALSRLEAAALRYSLHRAGRGELPEEDRRLVQDAISRLSRGLGLSLDGFVS